MSTFKYFTLVNGDYKVIPNVGAVLGSTVVTAGESFVKFNTWDLRIEYDETGRPIDAQFAVGACTVPKDDGWQDWPGGPCPAALDTLVDVTLRSGAVSLNTAAFALWWHHEPGPLDIVKWRLARG